MRYGRLEGDELERELSQVLLVSLTVGVMQASSVEGASEEWLTEVAGLLHGGIVREPSDVQAFAEAVVGQGDVEQQWGEALAVALEGLCGRSTRRSTSGS